MTYVIEWSSQLNGDTGTYAPSNIGKTTIDIADNTTYEFGSPNASGVTLTGKGLSGYGMIQQENFIQMLENFASETAPGDPTIGQLWYQTNTNTLNIWALTTPGTPPYGAWEPVYPAAISAGSIASALGYTPYNATTNSDGFISTTNFGAGAVILTGTPNEIIVTTTSGAVTLSTPQAIATTSSPTFANITITGPQSGNASDVVTKGYVDAATTGLSWKNSVAVATTANITLSGEQTIDGYTTSASRVLVKNQSTASQNGIYVSGAGAWARSSDTSTGAELIGAAVYVDNGTTQESTAWTCTNTGTITIGTTAVTFAQFGGGSVYSAGTGLSLTGNTFANTGVVSLIAGAGINISAGTGNVTISSDGGVTSLTGTANEVTVSASTGAITLSLPSTCTINITGNSATCGGYTPSPSAGTGSRIVVADGSGYINNTYFNSSDNAVASGITYLMCKAGDNYIRSGTAGAVAAFISGQSMNINGNASTSTVSSSTNAINSSNSYTMAGLAVNGSITATGNITAYYSDMRLKNVHGRIESALDKVCTLDGFYFTANAKAQALGYSGSVMDVGLSAQQVQKILPEIIKPAPIDPEYMTLDYAKLVPLLVEAIKELRQELHALKAKG